MWEPKNKKKKHTQTGLNNLFALLYAISIRMRDAMFQQIKK